MILHIVGRAAWEQAQAEGLYRGDTLATEGFIHCSTEQTVLKVANRLFVGRTDLLLLYIDPANVEPEILYEGPYGGDYYPHIYGPLNLDGVIRVAAFSPEADGSFRIPQ